MTIDPAPPAPPTRPASEPGSGPVRETVPARARRAFAERLAEDPPAALAVAVGRPGPGPLREIHAVAPAPAPRAVTPPPSLEALGVVSLRVRSGPGAGEVTLRIRSGDGLLEVRLRESPRAGVEITLTGSVPEADLERLGGLIGRRLGPEARVEIASRPEPRRGDDDPRERQHRPPPDELEALLAGPRARRRARSGPR